MNNLITPPVAGSPPRAGEKDIPQHVLDYIAHTAAIRYPGWADNEHPDARAYNAYQLGAVEHFLFEQAEVSAAEGYELLRQTLIKYVACNEATENEVFLRLRGKRSWTRAEFVQELRENGPQALSMMVTLMASAAHLTTQDKRYPVPAEGVLAYAEKAEAFTQIDVIEEALREAQAERTSDTTYALENAVADSLPKIQRALAALAYHAGDPTLTTLAVTGPAQELANRLEHLAKAVFDQHPLPWQATTSYPPYISVPTGEVGRHAKILEGWDTNEIQFITELVNAWPRLRSVFPFASPADLVAPDQKPPEYAMPRLEFVPLEKRTAYFGPVTQEYASKAPLAHREAARDLCYALRDLEPLDSGANDYAARNLILVAFAKLSPADTAEKVGEKDSGEK